MPGADEHADARPDNTPTNTPQATNTPVPPTATNTLPPTATPAFNPAEMNKVPLGGDCDVAPSGLPVCNLWLCDDTRRAPDPSARARAKAI